MLPAAAEGKGPWGSQLAGADSRLQFVGEGSEDLVELLIAAGLAAAGRPRTPQRHGCRWDRVGPWVPFPDVSKSQTLESNDSSSACLLAV